MSVTHSRFGTLGRLGNQIMQLMALYGIASRYKTQLVLPEWKYRKYFKNYPGIIAASTLKGVHEPHYHHSWDWLDRLDFSTEIAVDGYLQSPKYYQHCHEEVLQALEFEPSFEQDMIAMHHQWFSRKTIAISIRRGDFVNNPVYSQLPAIYYISALIEHFPDWKDCNIIFFSDDIAYCKLQFETLDNAYFAEGLNDIEQLCLLTHCKDFILSNSTFSHCGAILRKNKSAKIIRPVHLFGEEYRRLNSEADYWPEGWTVHETQRLSLTDVTFMIPVKFDHNDRKQNVDLCVCMLQRDFDTNIIIGEQDGQRFSYMQQWCKYMSFPEMTAFHRTKMLNEMAMAAETDIIVNWDADVFIPPLQVYLAAQRIRSGIDMVYPYDGRFARVPRNWFTKMEKSLDLGIFRDTQFKGKHGRPVPTSSVGGAIMVSKESFIEGGMENEWMISYGPEDCERWDRFHALGYKVERILGSLYHMDHYCGPDSSSRNPLFRKNHDELDKIRAMSGDELRQYVNSWPWVHFYTENYYHRISPGAIASAQEVYSVLSDEGIKMGNVIDIGCGVGEWGHQQRAVDSYTGVDYKVRKKSLLIDAEHYIDFNLASSEPFPLKKKFDTVLCLEVAEHLPEEKADDLIQLLTGLGKKILFSAAVPGQGGTGHVNEQMASYWVEKFAARGFYPHEFDIRKALFHNSNVEVWYKQNLILFTKKKYDISYEVDFIHPQMWKNHMCKKPLELF